MNGKDKWTRMKPSKKKLLLECMNRCVMGGSSRRSTSFSTETNASTAYKVIYKSQQFKHLPVDVCITYTYKVDRDLPAFNPHENSIYARITLSRLEVFK